MTEVLAPDIYIELTGYNFLKNTQTAFLAKCGQDV
jgi:hypothetical protein